MEKEFKDRVNVINDIHKDKVQKLYDWVRQIIVIATALLSILVALHTKKVECVYEKYTYLITIILLGLGILSGVIFLFSEISNLKKTGLAMTEQLSKYIAGEKTDTIVDIEPSKIFGISFCIFVTSLTLSVVNIIVYAFFNA